MCLNPLDPQSLRVFTTEGAYPTLSGYSPGSGLQRHGILQPCSAWCFTQNVREEVRIIGGHGSVAGALSAEGGSHQQNYVVQEVLNP